MLIDFHTHIFPDKIAKRTLDALAANSDNHPYTEGTAESLINSMTVAGADISVNLPVLTKPEQFESVLDFAVHLNEIYKDGDKKIISFAGIHPYCENVKEKLKRVKDSGIKGIKIHPDFQNTFIDDEKYFEILKAAKDNDLIVVTHAGVDDGFIGQPVKCPPERVASVLKRINYDKIVLAHYGGHKLWQKVLELLVGFDVYFDTAFTFYAIDGKLFKEILYAHGADKILFATDSPWSDLNRDKETFLSYGLSKDVQDKIFYKNAAKLLDLKV